MGRLDDVTLEERQELRKQTAGEIPRERVLAAIGRKQGETLETLAERHDGVEKPIRNWLDRFDEEPIEQAPPRCSPIGTPSNTRRGAARTPVRAAPTATNLGYDHQAWALTLLLHHVHEEDGVAYSEGHARKRLSAAELSSRTARPRTHEADPDNEAEFQQTVEKNGRS